MRAIKHLTQSLTKFPDLEFKMLKEGFSIPKMSEGLPMKKSCSQ